MRIGKYVREWEHNYNKWKKWYYLIWGIFNLKLNSFFFILKSYLRVGNKRAAREREMNDNKERERGKKEGEIKEKKRRGDWERERGRDRE